MKDLRLSLVFVATAVIVAAGRAAFAQEAPAQPTTEQIRGWVAQLGDGSFSVRQEAVANLREAGAAAIEPLREGAGRGDLETVFQSVRLLAELSRAEDEATATTAREALTALARPRVTLAAEQAAAALDALAAIDEKRALEAVFSQGAQYGSGTNNAQGSVEVTSHLWIASGWQGKDEGLRWLKFLRGIDYVSIHGTQIGDDSLEYLKPLSRLKKLELYGTKFSAEGLAQLRDALPAVELDIRRGGMLGVSGPREGACQFTTVRPDSAAEKAGIQPGDLVTECEGKPITTFEDLTAIISEKAPGEKLKLVLLRDGDRLTKEVTLGAWE
jgi:hypothetical protein